MEWLIRTQKVPWRPGHERIEGDFLGGDSLENAGGCTNRACELLCRMRSIYTHSLAWPVELEAMLRRWDCEEEMQMPVSGDFRMYYVILKKSTEADGEYFEHLLF